MRASPAAHVHPGLPLWPDEHKNTTDFYTLAVQASARRAKGWGLDKRLAVTRIISWNLWRLKGASLSDVTQLARQERPDLLLMQEATVDMDALPQEIGGFYARVPLPGRIHGLAMWSPIARHKPRVVHLPAGAVVDRVCQIVDLGGFSVANVHLSHGQVLNRRQLRHIAAHMPYRAAVLGDYNLVGPALLPGFRDVGPREHTHLCADMVPLRLDRCYVRGLACATSRALAWSASDHRPILVNLSAVTTAKRLAA
jgi:endonuclease/exonuclease/phosphatase (EEP) superfamily protein YafD